MSNVLKAIVVGCGRIAGEIDRHGQREMVLSHAGAYSRHEGFELVACVDPEEQRRRDFAKTWNIPFSFGSLHEIVDDDLSFDVASVCAPTANHGDILEQLLETKAKAVFCEKPLTDDVAQSRRLVEAYAKSNKALIVNYQRRWDPNIRALKEDIESGKWGRVRCACGFYNKGILNNGSHLVDLAQYLLGSLDLVAVTGAKIDYDSKDPTVDAVLQTGDGIAVHLVGTDFRDMAFFEFHIVTENGVIGIEEFGFVIRLRDSGPSSFIPGYKQAERGRWEKTGYGRAMLHAVDNLHAAVASGEAIKSDGANALSVQILCHQVQDMAMSQGFAS